jgi:hypothetical protein
MALPALRRENEKATQMSDYAEPLIVIKELHRKAREAMQEKQWVRAITCIDGILAQACLARAEAIAQLEKKPR